MNNETDDLERAEAIAYALEKDYEVALRIDLPIEVRRAALQHLRESLVPLAAAYIEMLFLNVEDDILQ